MNQDPKFKVDTSKRFTHVANLILEALPLSKLNRTQQDICIYLLRRTYGWKRDRDAIALKEFAVACGHSKSYVSTQLKFLLTNNVIRRYGYFGKTPVYSVVDNLAEWNGKCIDLDRLVQNQADRIYKCSSYECLAETCETETSLMNYTDPVAGQFQDVNSDKPADSCSGPAPDPDSGSEQIEISELDTFQNTETKTKDGFHNSYNDGFQKSETHHYSSSETVHQEPAQDQPEIERSLKKELKKDKEIFFSPDSPAYRLSALLLRKIKEHHPDYKDPDLQKWSRSMDLVLRLDQREEEQVEKVILFCQKDLFWQTNILSVDNLRKHFDRLNIKRKLERSSSGHNQGKDEWFIDTDEYERFFD